jgi:hypothetical protein
MDLNVSEDFTASIFECWHRFTRKVDIKASKGYTASIFRDYDRVD